ncbi:MAG: glutaredoxin [Spirochaetales bacterium]|nr:glutaredoxin [Spirochaetales bacterium]
MDMESVEWMEHEGENNSHEIFLIGLSTCGFCKMAIDFLDTHSFAYKFIFSDRLSPDDRTKLKDEYKKEYGNRLLYPTAIIDRKEILTGFIKPSWEKALTLMPDTE